MKLSLLLSISLLLSTSCELWLGPSFETKKLNLKTIKNKDVKIEIYDISLITSGHQIVDLTDKYFKETTSIYKAGQNQLTDVKMRNDTIFLYTKRDDMHFYELAAVKYEYTIQVVPENKTKK
jgi:hypothetical protein